MRLLVSQLVHHLLSLVLSPPIFRVGSLAPSPLVFHQAYLVDTHLDSHLCSRVQALQVCRALNQVQNPLVGRQESQVLVPQASPLGTQV